MQSYKDLLNRVAKNGQGLKELTPEESAALKNCLMDIFQQITSVCQAHDLTVMLGGGSCLGAVRHQGFIPWDDDLDLLMPRKDYERFIQLCEHGALGSDLFIAYPNSQTDAPTMFLKVFMKGTLMKGLGGETSPYPQECFIDIFPIEGMPSRHFMRRLKAFCANSLRLIANMVAESGSLSVEEKNFYASDKSLRRYMAFRRFAGKCFSLVSHQRWIWWYDRFVRDLSVEKLTGIPTGRKLYDGETFPASVYFPPSRGLFEGQEVCLPADTDRYLTNLYHDYMQLPPEEKRERHLFIEFNVPDKYYT